MVERLAPFLRMVSYSGMEVKFYYHLTRPRLVLPRMEIVLSEATTFLAKLRDIGAQK